VSRKPLRAVSDVDAPLSGSRSVTAAAEHGTTRELLVAMRARVAAAVEDSGTPARDLASLTKRLMDIARDIEAIDARDQQEGSSRRGPVPDEAFDASAV